MLLEVALCVLVLNGNHKFTHSSIKISAQCVEVCPVDQFELDRTAVSQRCLMSFYDRVKAG